jgi:hypothetical protein
MLPSASLIPLGNRSRIASDRVPMNFRFLEGLAHTQIVATIVLILLTVLLDVTGNRWLNKHPFRSMSYRRRWTIGLRNLRVILLLVGLILIWGTELRTAAISALAIIVALVIGTKELIMCILGSILKISGNSFGLGDRIRVGDNEGDVIDQNLLTTKIQQIIDGQYSGKVITLPNSVFLTQGIINSSLANGQVAFGILTIQLSPQDDWARHEKALLNAANSACSPHLTTLSDMLEGLKKHGIEMPGLHPHLIFKPIDKDKLDLILRYPTPAELRLKVEQTILRTYLTEIRSTTSTSDKQTAP